MEVGSGSTVITSFLQSSVAYYRITGMQDVQRLVKGTGFTPSIGDLCQTDESAGTIIAAATNAPVKGVVRQTDASSNSNYIEVDVAHPGDRFRVDMKSGETMAASYDGKFGDIANTNTTVTQTVTNSDVRLYFNGSTDTADVTFTTLETGGPFT